MDYSAPKVQSDRWIRDLTHILARAGERQSPSRPKLLAEYYALHYPDDPHSRETQERLLVCCDYLLEHLPDFVVEHMARPTESGCWLSPHLDAALYRLFAGIEFEKLHAKIAVSVVLEIAEEQQRLHPDV